MELPDYLLGVPEDGAGPRPAKLEINGIVYFGWPSNLFWRKPDVVSFDLLDAIGRPIMRNVCPQTDAVIELNQSVRE